MTKLAEELGREPNLSEIAAKMQMSEDEVQAVMKEAINAVAVDRSEAAQKEDEALEKSVSKKKYSGREALLYETGDCKAVYCCTDCGYGNQQYCY